MKTIADIVSFIERQPEMVRLLYVVETLALPDCWIGGGFVRNAVWDVLHGGDCSGSNDVDVVYFDAADARAKRDAELELRLLAAYPHVRWDVKNQARMHLHNGEAPYMNTEGAMARWPETATAVAVRRRLGRVELIAPHGVGDLLNLIVRPTPAFRSRSELVARRIEEKGWRLRWPQLAMAGFEGE